MEKELKQAIKIAKTADLDVFPGYEFGNTIENFANDLEWTAGYADADNDEGYHPVAEDDIVVEASGTMGEGDDEFQFSMQFVFPQDTNEMYLCYGEIDNEMVDDLDEFFDVFSALFEDDDDDDDDEEYDEDEDESEDEEEDEEEDGRRPHRTPSSMRVSDLERVNDDFDRPER